jgi:hypothetical protein
VKRVRYLAGVAGLAPMAIGMALPATGHAAAATTHSPARGKSVSMAHVRSPLRPATGCTGNTAFNVPQSGDVKAHGWYADNYFDTYVCIGTVKESVYFTKGTSSHPFCKYAWVRAWETSSKGGSFNAFETGHQEVCGVAGNWTGPISFGIHDSFDVWGNLGWVIVFPTSTYGGGFQKQIT